jgi:hypothetical protein
MARLRAAQLDTRPNRESDSVYLRYTPMGFTPQATSMRQPRTYRVVKASAATVALAGPGLWPVVSSHPGYGRRQKNDSTEEERRIPLPVELGRLLRRT